MAPKLMWDDKYSVKVKRIDEQHKLMFETINKLIDLLASKPVKEEVDQVISSLVEYKKIHFATEEAIFDEFGYEEGEEHKAKHREFGVKLDEITKQHEGDLIGFAFALVDYLEDWLINHLMTMDQKYVAFMERNHVV